MKTKKFDCVEMKRQGAEIVQNKIAGMTEEQELEYWRKQTEEFKKEIARRISDHGNNEATQASSRFNAAKVDERAKKIKVKSFAAVAAHA